MDKTRQRDAAAELEDISVMIKEAVIKLREGQSDELTYALVYDIRKRLGAVVRRLGSGVPNTTHAKKAADILESVVWNEAPTRRI